MEKIPTNKTEFNIIITHIDNQLISESIPVENRPMRAVGMYSDMFDITIPMPLDAEAKEGVYYGSSASAHIDKWYKEMYGDRLKYYANNRRTVFLLRNEPLEFRLPTVYGTVKFNLSFNLEDESNILKYINNITLTFVKSLNEQEFMHIANTFILHMDCINRIDETRGSKFYQEAISDLKAAVIHITEKPPHYGQSKWSSAQAAEKFLKSYLTKKVGNFQRTHNLKQLYNESIKNGLKEIDSKIIDLLQTSPSVRYGEETISLETAASSYEEALKMGKLISEQK